MDLKYLKKKLTEWKKTLSGEPDYWDGVCCSDRGMYGGAVSDFLNWLETNSYTPWTLYSPLSLRPSARALNG
jgi:hypothetical protein